MIGLESYQNATKETWRCWQWNRIVDLLLGDRPGKPWSKIDSREKRRLLSDKTVLYLCGPDDVDRTIAMRHGFSHANLIAVDQEESNVKAVRDAGGLGVSLNLLGLLLFWPGDWPIDAIVADLCCPYNATAVSLMASLLLCEAVQSRPSIVSINLQRGRDAITNERRAYLNKCLVIGSDKNRSVNFICELIQYSVAMNLGLRMDELFKKVNYLPSKDVINTMAAKAYVYMNPHGMSYRSSRVIMDSSVFRVPVVLPNQNTEESRRILFGGIKDESKYIRQRIAALRAVRTVKRQKAALV